MRRPLVAILACAALEASGIALIFPTLPKLLRVMAGTDNVSALYGMLLALHAPTQFVITPVLGVLSDRLGRRPVLLLALTGSTIDYLVMSFTPYPWLLFVSRTIAGLTAAGVAMITATIADVTPEAERARRFGLFHACFGAGFVVGPVIGGLLGDLSRRAPFLAAAVLSSVNVLIALFVLPETHRTAHKPFAWRTLNPFAPLRWALTFRTLIPLLTVFLLVSLVGQTYSTVWVLFVTDRFKWTTSDIGFAQASWIAFALIPLVAFGGISAPALRALQSKAVDGERQGQLQGVVASFVSLAAILGPLAFGEIYALSRPDRTGLVWIIGVAILAIAVPMVLTEPKRVAEQG